MLKQARIKTRDKSRQANKSGNDQAKSKMLINRLSPGEKAKKILKNTGKQTQGKTQ